MLRSILSVVAGVIAGCFIILILEGIGHNLFPPPAGLDPTAPGAIKSVPVGAKIAVLAAWFGGAFGGGIVASLIARRWAPAAWVVAATILLLAGVTMTQFPHPAWMMIGAIIVTAAGGFAAVAVTGSYYGRPSSGGPKPGL